MRYYRRRVAAWRLRRAHWNLARADAHWRRHPGAEAFARRTHARLVALDRIADLIDISRPPKAGAE